MEHTNTGAKALRRQGQLYLLAKAIERCAKNAEKLDLYMGNGGDIASMLNGIASEVDAIRGKESVSDDPARYL